MKYHNEMSTSALVAEREGIFKYVMKRRFVENIADAEYDLMQAEFCLASVEEVLRKDRHERLLEAPPEYTEKLQTCAYTKFEFSLDKVVICVRKGLRKYCYLHRGL